MNWNLKCGDIAFLKRPGDGGGMITAVVTEVVRFDHDFDNPVYHGKILTSTHKIPKSQTITLTFEDEYVMDVLKLRDNVAIEKETK